MKIPDQLLNSETKEHFKECLVCGSDLISSGEPYVIEKIYRRVKSLDLDEVIFEFAICMQCAHDMRNELSKESLQKMEQFQREELLPHLSNHEDPDSFDFDHCAVTGKSIKDSDEYSYHALCQGDQIYPGMKPYVVSSEILDKIGDQLSDKTIDAMDDFKGRHFTGPPEVAKLLSPKRLISI